MSNLFKTVFILYIIQLISCSILHPPGKSGEVLFDLNGDNFDYVVTEMVDKPKDTLPLFVIMM